MSDRIVCSVCKARDPNAHVTCNYPGCPDGRDWPVKTYPSEPYKTDPNLVLVLMCIGALILILALAA